MDEKTHKYVLLALLIGSAILAIAGVVLIRMHG